MKLRDAIKDLHQRLQEAQVPEAEHDARAIAAHVLRIPLTQLAVQQERLLTTDHLAAMDVLAVARARREPLQYLLGCTGFYGREFTCDSRALIPRPDTETLVEVALELIRDLHLRVVADVGTGTGIIGITLAAEVQGLKVLATDASADALALAAENVGRHRLDSRVTLAQGQWLEPALADDWRERVELVVSNPPYIRADEIGSLMPEVSKHEPRQALAGGGEDALGAYRAIIEQCASLPKLRAIVFEVGEGQAAQVAGLLSQTPGICESIIRKDLGSIDRVVAAVIGAAE
jgi:release factor glutamine methyltransferase